MSWRLATSLITLRDQLNQMHPGRSKASDGTIGDVAHQAEGSASDHNPWITGAGGVGVVTALDVTHDPVHGLDIAALGQALADSRDGRIKYVIQNSLILVPEDGWNWQRYQGSDPHTNHLHISVNTWNYDVPQEWKLNEGGDMPSTIGDDEVRLAWPALYGYAATQGDMDAWRGTESNTAFRAWIANATLRQNAIREAFRKAALYDAGSSNGEQYEPVTVYRKVK